MFSLNTASSPNYNIRKGGPSTLYYKMFLYMAELENLRHTYL